MNDRQESELFTAESASAEDAAVWNRIQGKLAKKRLRKRRFMLCAACAVMAGILTAVGLSLPSGLSEGGYQSGEVTIREDSFENFEAYCRKNRLLGPNLETDMIDILGIKVYDKDNIHCAFRAQFLYNGEIEYLLTVTADPLFIIDGTDVVKLSDYFQVFGGYETRCLSQTNSTKYYLAQGKAQYFLEVQADERRSRPIAANLFGERS